VCCEQTYCYLLTAGPGGDDATVCRHGGRCKCQMCSVSVWSVLVPAGEYDGSICAVCRHGGRCKCQIANTMDRSVQFVGMVVPSASWRIRWIDLCSVSAWRYRRHSITNHKHRSIHRIRYLALAPTTMPTHCTDRSIVFTIFHAFFQAILHIK